MTVYDAHIATLETAGTGDLLLVPCGRRSPDAVTLTDDGDHAALDAAPTTELVP